VSLRARQADLPNYEAYQTIRSQLIDDGWRTPNTYCNVFEPIANVSAVYLFLMVDKAHYERGFVAYVGMSQNLKQRISGHPILLEIRDRGHWIMTWFRPQKKSSLRETEARYIARFDPPWNIVGKQRGVTL
jgi:hypothetical protein